jgi:hypothetical protein
VQGQKFINAVDLVISDTTKNIGQPCLRIDTVQLGGLDQSLGDGGGMSCSLGAGEQPGPRAVALEFQSLITSRASSPDAYKDSGLINNPDYTLARPANCRGNQAQFTFCAIPTTF